MMKFKKQKNPKQKIVIKGMRNKIETKKLY